MNRRSIPLDWLKALGITVIVWGHVIGIPALNTLHPIYIKQFGVAFFVFVTGYTVARDSRPWRTLVARRLFEPYLFGLATALVLSAYALVAWGTIQKSNYLPFVGGVNVLLDYFPANPTTWYLGCYLHTLLAAAWMRRLNWKPLWLVAIAMMEIAVRVALLSTGRHFMSYMLLPNWTSSLALGFYLSRNALDARRILVAGALALGIALLVGPVESSGFPFILGSAPGMATLIRGSIAVTLLYSSMSALVFAAATWCPIESGLVKLIANNTLLIFLLHMPLFYALDGRLPATLGKLSRGGIYFVICMVVPLLISVSIHAWLDLGRLRARVGLGQVSA